MKKNMGTCDRVVRTIVALAIVGLYLAGIIGGVTAAVLGVVAAAFFVTSAIGSCPMYGPLGISTRKEPSETARV